MIDPVHDLAREALFVCLKVGAPVLLVALVVGLLVSFVQAITQLQEPTLTFVPKIIGIFATMALAMPFMLATLITFTEALFAQIGGGALTLLLTSEVALHGLVFARLGAAIMLVPVFGEGYVLSRARLAIALMLTVLLTPVLREQLPSFESFDGAYALLIVGEVVHGLFIGAFVRLSIAVLSIAGMIIAMQMGFAAANFFNPAEATQGSATGNLLTAAGLVTLVLIDGHHGILFGLVASYEALPPGASDTAIDMAGAMARGSADAVTLGLQLAMPVTVVSLVLYAMMGMMSRLVPTLQVVFVAMPVQIALGLAIMALAMGAMLEMYAGFVADLVYQLGA